MPSPVDVSSRTKGRDPNYRKARRRRPGSTNPDLPGLPADSVGGPYISLRPILQVSCAAVPRPVRVFPSQGFFRITHTFNTGSIFGLFQGNNTPLILVSFVGVAVLILLCRSQRFPTGLLRLSLGLQLGGAFGNLVDRLRLGHVIDWVDIGPWPVFNVADACIVTGLIILAWLFIMAERTASGQPASHDAYSHCPVCDGEMRALAAGGWRCSTCGVRERILALPHPGTGDHPP